MVVAARAGVGGLADLRLRAVRELRLLGFGLFGFRLLGFTLLGFTAAATGAGVAGFADATLRVTPRGGGAAEMLAIRKPASVSLSC